MRSGIDCNGKTWVEWTKTTQKRYDITGQKFNYLTVLFRVDIEKPNYSWWLCRCDCGDEVVVRASFLKNGHTKSCGCMSNFLTSQKNSKELKPGEQYNYWTVVSKVQETGTGGKYICRCKCGNERIIPRQALVSGASKSCGCYQKEVISQQNLIDLVGKRFGCLTVLSRADVKVKGDVYWNVICDCGTKKVISGHSMRKGDIISCGCSNVSGGELEIKQILQENNIPFLAQYTFPDFPRKRYDFVILDSNNAVIRLIEYDGEQHYHPVDFFGEEEGFKKTVFRDQEKNHYAIVHNIPLIRIPYLKRRYITLNDILGDKYLIPEQKELL